MKHVIDLFSELGQRLQEFGTDPGTLRIVDLACESNPWFTPAEVRRAVAALADGMLRREVLRAWLAAYDLPVCAPRTVLVVMAGNIPLVGFHDLLCVVASGHRCLVKPSAKDTVLMTYIIELLRLIDPDVPVVLVDDATQADAVIATGSDNANRYFRAQYAGIPSLLRSSRRSVAVLSGNETPKQLVGLSDDIWAYSGLGCRNVSLVFLPEGCELKLEMPVVNDKYINNYTQARALRSMRGEPFLDLGGAMAVGQRAFPEALSELAYSHYRTTDEVVAWLAEHDAEIQCVVTECIPHGRRAGFGRAQAPALTDYPDARDVLAFLAALN